MWLLLPLFLIQAFAGTFQGRFLSHPATPVSTDFREKTVITQGTKYDYVTYEIDWDEEVYYGTGRQVNSLILSVENSPCSCVDGVQQCPKIVTDKKVDETGYDVAIMEKDTWYEVHSCSALVTKGEGYRHHCLL